MDTTLILFITIPIATFLSGLTIGHFGRPYLKKKHDLSLIKTMNHEAGVNILTAYKKIKNLDNIFKELEHAEG